MNIEYISQPFLPEDQWLGHHLRALLMGEEGHFDRFIASVAFIKFSGISRIYSALEAFRNAGGQSVVISGIDHRGTSKQGLTFLREVVDQVFIYHDESPERRTFHPKLYLFEQTNQRAIIIVGSGNLTAGGLFTNYEAHIRIELNLTDDPQNDEDRAFFESVLDKLRVLQDTSSSCVQELTDETFTRIEADLPDEAASESEDAAGDETEDEATEPIPSSTRASSRLFGRSRFPRAPRPDISLDRKRRKSRRGSIGSVATLPGFTIPTATGFWKVLSAFDVSTTSAPGQIIIPIQFRDFFEPLELTKQPDIGGKGRQWEGAFPTQFRDGSFTLNVDARCIVYEPETDHPRQNTECRFTFRNRDILERLRAGDILIFNRTSAGGIQIDVERVTSSDSRHRTLYSRPGGRFGWLS
jgi:HKD family nuclease